MADQVGYSSPFALSTAFKRCTRNQPSTAPHRSLSPSVYDNHAAASDACPDRPIILSHQQLEYVLRVYVRHYNERRPHRALELQAPDPRTTPSVTTQPVESAGAVRRHDLLGGLIHEYEAAAP